MNRRKLSKSARKFIRRKKAEIRRQLLSFKEQEELITKLYKQFPNYKQSLKSKDIKA